MGKVTVVGMATMVSASSRSEGSFGSFDLRGELVEETSLGVWPAEQPAEFGGGASQRVAFAGVGVGGNFLAVGRRDGVHEVLRGVPPELR